jgi:hypothetical protein
LAPVACAQPRHFEAVHCESSFDLGLRLTLANTEPI